MIKVITHRDFIIMKSAMLDFIRVNSSDLHASKRESRIPEPRLALTSKCPRKVQSLGIWPSLSDSKFG